MKNSYIILNPQTHKRNPFGFVEFFTKEAAEKALLIHQHNIKNSRIVCNKYKAKEANNLLNNTSSSNRPLHRLHAQHCSNNLTYLNDPIKGQHSQQIMHGKMNSLQVQMPQQLDKKRNYYFDHSYTVSSSIIDLNSCVKSRNDPNFEEKKSQHNFSSLDKLLSSDLGIIASNKNHKTAVYTQLSMKKLYSDLSIFCKPEAEEKPNAHQKPNFRDKKRTWDCIYNLESPFRPSRPERFLTLLATTREGYAGMFKSQERIKLPQLLFKTHSVLNSKFTWSNSFEAGCQVGNIKFNVSLRPQNY